MNQQEFEQKYHYKVVRPKGEVIKIPIKDYIVTSALYKYEQGDTTILALKALDYTLENKHWITIKIAPESLESYLGDIEVLRCGYDECVKPVIVSEQLFTCQGEDDDSWMMAISEYGKSGPLKTDYMKFPKDKMKREMLVGRDEYLFTYKSVFDVGAPSSYLITIPSGLQYKEDIDEYVKPFRQDILDNKVAFGVKVEKQQV